MTGAGRPITPENLAVCHYLLGTLLLNDLVTNADEVDGQVHLALVTGTGRGSYGTASR
jgi:hypothetical protein